MLPYACKLRCKFFPFPFFCWDGDASSKWVFIWSSRKAEEQAQQIYVPRDKPSPNRTSHSKDTGFRQQHARHHGAIAGHGRCPIYRQPARATPAHASLGARTYANDYSIPRRPARSRQPCIIPVVAEDQGNWVVGPPVKREPRGPPRGPVLTCPLWNLVFILDREYIKSFFIPLLSPSSWIHG
jgi:hypothetical protein